ncbi:phosphate signaling complex protein PhoU [Blastopirellula marina]|uniref:Phosphate-specific transport system accessory protein PhoU n=1 Tax=Blastopirellula marina TaxID=124 RepID=A0A2S8GM81_9BACT|nr:phosphate signaling complex protein PhoU [Blastopirellula marina]PQO45530.1 phosphate transport system regulatory protein PhoU [Blastopirellula marina]
MTQHWIRQIEEVRSQLLSMGTNAEAQVGEATRALHDLDRSRALAVIAADDALDAMDIAIEEECLHSIALFQPVASDLRLIVAAMSVGHELERIGDLAVNIAGGVVRLRDSGKLPGQIILPECLQQANHMAMEMLRKSLDAFIERDTSECRKLICQDRELDRLHRAIFEWLKEGLQKTPADLDWMIEVTSISKHIERIADHVTNIAEIVIYWVEGEIVRHRQVIGPAKEQDQ